MMVSMRNKNIQSNPTIQSSSHDAILLKGKNICKNPHFAFVCSAHKMHYTIFHNTIPGIPKVMGSPKWLSFTNLKLVFISNAVLEHKMMLLTNVLFKLDVSRHNTINSILDSLQ